MLTPKRPRRFGKDHFEGGPDVCLHEVPAMSGAVAFANHDVGMHFRLSVVERNVTDERKYLRLLANFSRFLILFLVPIEVDESDVG